MINNNRIEKFMKQMQRVILVIIIYNKFQILKKGES